MGRHILFFFCALAFFTLLKSAKFLGTEYLSFITAVMNNFYSAGAVATWALVSIIYLPLFATGCAARNKTGRFPQAIHESVIWFENTLIESIAIILALGFVAGSEMATNHLIAFTIIISIFMLYAFCVGSGWFFNGDQRKGYISGYAISLLPITVISAQICFGETKLHQIIQYFTYAAYGILSIGLIFALIRKVGQKLKPSRPSAS